MYMYVPVKKKMKSESLSSWQNSRNGNRLSPGSYDGMGGWINGGAGIALGGNLVNGMDIAGCESHYTDRQNWNYNPIVSLLNPYAYGFFSDGWHFFFKKKL